MDAAVQSFVVVDIHQVGVHMWNASLGQWCLLILQSSIKCVHAQDVRLLMPFLSSPAYMVCLLDAFCVPDPVEQNLQ